MKRILATLILSAICSLSLKAQTVYSTDYKSDADVKVYVAKYKSDAAAPADQILDFIPIPCVRFGLILYGWASKTLFSRTLEALSVRRSKYYPSILMRHFSMNESECESEHATCTLRVPDYY